MTEPRADPAHIRWDCPSCSDQGRAAVVVGVDPAAVHQRITDHLRDQHGHDEPNATTVVLRPDGTRWGQQP